MPLLLYNMRGAIDIEIVRDLCTEKEETAGDYSFPAGVNSQM